MNPVAMTHPKTLGILHTSFVLIDVLSELAKRYLPGVELINIVDDSLVRYVLAHGTDDVLRRRVKDYMQSAVDAGADFILSSCSSMGEAVDAGRDAIPVPVLKIDEAMAEKAVLLGPRIGIYATAASTFGPTTRLLHSKAKAAGRIIEPSEQICLGGFNLLLQGQIAKHDRLVVDTVVATASQYDVLVLAQASMARLAPAIASQIDCPMLSSPELAMERIASQLGAFP